MSRLILNHQSNNVILSHHQINIYQLNGHYFPNFSTLKRVMIFCKNNLNLLEMTFQQILFYIFNFRWQAWNPATPNRLGRRSSLHHTVPDPARTELCVQLYHYRPKGNPFMARTYFMAKGNSSWWYCCTP